MEIVDRFVTILEAGVDQFGDVWDQSVIAAAYEKLVAKYGAEAAEARIRRSGKRLPKNMETVEAHCEDLPFDLACYTDAQGHVWDFGYGLSLHGVLDSAVSDIYR